MKKKMHTKNELRAEGVLTKGKWHTSYPKGSDKRTFHTNVFDFNRVTNGISRMVEFIQPDCEFKIDVIVTTYHPAKTKKP